MNKITVRVPATTANIGPGFDSMGCALAPVSYTHLEVYKRQVVPLPPKSPKVGFLHN